MRQYKFYFIAAGVIISLLFLVSCRSDNATAKLALKHTQGQSESYRLQTVAQRKVSIQGQQPANPAAFQGGQTTDKIEIIFDQQVESINSAGNATKKITIKELKYFAEVRDKPVLEFDSSKVKDPNNALAALVGLSYTIEVTSSGQVLKIIDANNAREAIKNIPSNHQAADRLISDKTIIRHHSVPLPDAAGNELKSGQTWNNIVSFDFSQMGFRAYERAFTLEKIEKNGEQINAVINMNAIPSIKGEKNSGEELDAPELPPMTDIRQTYTGMMKMDVTNGTLLKYEEKLINEWLVVPPGSSQSGPPSVLNMTATQSYDIEKIK